MAKKNTRPRKKVDRDSIKHKRSPIKLKRFKRGTKVSWIGKRKGVLERKEGTVVFRVPKDKSLKTLRSRLNKRLTNPSVLEACHDNETRPRRSFIVAVRGKDGRDTLHWPKLSRLEAV